MAGSLKYWGFLPLAMRAMRGGAPAAGFGAAAAAARAEAPRLAARDRCGAGFAVPRGLRARADEVFLLAMLRLRLQRAISGAP
jgi:ADP-dependent phosphofructokinase/glucokinase